MANKDSQKYVVTARKWRPMRFDEIVGQGHVAKTLKNAIESGRVHHAYLFSGPRGVGKTTTARIYARALNCSNPQDFEPCNECDNCRGVLDSRSMDIIEIDGASNNSVDDVRKLRDNAKYPPVIGKYKMYIVDEVHMLSNSAFNALLKILEEPPEHLMFVFATTEAHKLPATILSRCQRYDFRRMEIKDITGQLSFIAEREGINIDEESLISIARKADGSMRDSQSIFDQVVAFCGNDIKYENMVNALNLIDQAFFFRISNAVRDHNIPEMFDITRQVIVRGYDLKDCLSGLLEHFRNLLAVKVTGDASYIEGSQQIIEQYKSEAGAFQKSDLLRLMNIVSATESELRFAPQPRVRFELALIKMASIDSSIEIKQLLEEISKLKKNSDSQPIATAQATATPQPATNQAQARPAHAPARRPVETPQPTAPQPGGKSDADSLRNGWPAFLEHYANAETGLYMLKQTENVEIAYGDGEITIVIKEEFLHSNLKRVKLKLSEMLRKHYGADILVVLPSPNTGLPNLKTTQENKQNLTASSDNNSSPSTKPLHPVEEAIIKNFNAKEIK